MSLHPKYTARIEGPLRPRRLWNVDPWYPLQRYKRISGCRTELPKCAAITGSQL